MRFDGVKAIVTDIEGTTSSLSFVKDVLFPYAQAHLAEYVQAHKDDTAVREILADAAREMTDAAPDDEALIAQMLRWIEEDKKITALKSLQGLIWEHGYQQGDYQGHLYDDAAEGLRRWQQAGIRLFVYSSGSVYAQKLLFAHSDHGDITPLFEGYFDTRIGHKRETDSYQQICNSINLSADAILFLSDINEELDAAKSVGMQTCGLVREGNVEAHATHPQVASFADISLD